MTSVTATGSSPAPAASSGPVLVTAGGGGPVRAEPGTQLEARALSRAVKGSVEVAMGDQTLTLKASSLPAIAEGARLTVLVGGQGQLMLTAVNGRSLGGADLGAQTAARANMGEGGATSAAGANPTTSSAGDTATSTTSSTAALSQSPAAAPSATLGVTATVLRAAPESAAGLPSLATGTQVSVRIVDIVAPTPQTPAPTAAASGAGQSAADSTATPPPGSGQAAAGPTRGGPSLAAAWPSNPPPAGPQAQTPAPAPATASQPNPTVPGNVAPNPSVSSGTSPDSGPVGMAANPAGPAAPAPASAPISPPAGAAAPVAVPPVAVPPTGIAAANPAPLTLTGTVVAQPPAGQAVVATAIGTLAVPVPAPVEVGTTLRLELGAGQTPAPAPAAPPEGLTRQGWPALTETLTALGSTDGAALDTLMRALPQGGPHLAAAMAAFAGSMRRGQGRLALGEEPLRVLEKAGRGDLAQRLRGDLDALEEKPARTMAGAEGWQAQTMPFVHQGAIEAIALYVRGGISDQEGGGKGQGKGGGDQRFILDFRLSNLGRLQLDGLVRQPDKLFDLIIRTQAPLPERMRMEIMAIFTQAAELVGTKGGVMFQAGGAWVDFQPAQASRPLSIEA